MGRGARGAGGAGGRADRGGGVAAFDAERRHLQRAMMRPVGKKRRIRVLLGFSGCKKLVAEQKT